MIDPDVILDGKGVIVISSEEGETECNNDKQLHQLSIVDGCILKVDDFFQNYELSVTIVHKPVERDAELFEIIADPEVLKQAQSAAADTKMDEKTDEAGPSTSKKHQNGNGQSLAATSDDDDLCLVEDGDDGESSAAVTAPKKRKARDDEEPSAKRCKTIDNDDDDLIMLDD